MPAKTSSVFRGGGGVMGHKIREFDWRSTSLGPIDTWSGVMRATIDLILSSGFPACLFWGPDLIAIYNDAYRPMLGDKPEALGQALRVTWAEAWEQLSPIAEAAMAGKSTFVADYPLQIDRRGYVEEAFFTFSYSPIRDEAGEVIGIIDTVVETTGKITAQRERAAEQARQKALLQQMPGFVGVLEGPTHVYSYVNDAYITISGARDFIGHTVRDVFPELEGQGFHELLDEVYATGKPFVARAVPIRLTGEAQSRFIDLLYEAIRDTGGHITGIFVGGYDVTEAEWRAKALSDLNADLERQIIAQTATRGKTWQLSPDLLGALNAEGYFETSNPAWQTVLGWSEREVAGMSIFEFLHPDDVERTRVGFQLTQVGQPAIRFPNRYRCKDGGYRWISWVGIPEGGLVYCSGRDITEEREQADALARTMAERNVLATVFESTDAFIHVVDADFRWLAINKAGADEFARVFGPYPKVGDRMLDLLDDQPVQRAAAEAVWSRALAGEEFTAISEFGEIVGENIYEMKFNSLYDDTGTRVGAYQVVTNINDRIAAQRKLETAQEALRQSQKMEAVGQLTGGIAHDFNNMLAVVMGSLDLLNRRIGTDDPRSKRYVESAMDGAKRSANLTQRLLAFSRQQPLQPKSLEPNRLVTGMSDLLRHSIGADIRMETVLAGGLWRINADPNQLESVILNLAVNARDAMPGGGHLTIETQNTHLDSRYILNEPGVAAGQYVMIAVTDTGSGMPADIIEKAFDPFFTTKGVGKGTGLGLSQVYGFVKQSGGHVKIYSELGQGTTIKIYLPRDMAGDAETDQADAYADPILGEAQEIILVVDDEPAVRQFTCDALTELGYGILEADSAETALRMVKAHPEISMLLTDIVMPDTNGRQLADACHAVRPDLKVLYTTGYTRNAVVHNGILDAGVELIGKPFTIDELATRVRTVLDA